MHVGEILGLPGRLIAGPADDRLTEAVDLLRGASEDLSAVRAAIEPAAARIAALEATASRLDARLADLQRRLDEVADTLPGPGPVERVKDALGGD
jgi:DNA-binding FadR family transcriptional regulator